MLRLTRRACAILTAIGVVAVAPAVASAAGVTSTTITNWSSSEPGTPANASFLISDDNPTSPSNPAYPTKLTVSGQANPGAFGSSVDIVCYFGGAPSQWKILASGLPVHADNTFTTPTGSSAPLLKGIEGHACRLRAVPTNQEAASDVPAYAGPQVAVSQVGLPSASVAGHPFDFYAIDTTLTGYAGWNSAGSCGPYLAPLAPSYGMGNFALDCVGSLLGSNAPSGTGTRSEVLVDGRDAYDAASAQAVFGGTVPSNFPSLTPTSVQLDPTAGVMASQSSEGWVVCPGDSDYPPKTSDCPHFASAGVSLQRNIVTSDGGQVVTLTDTWSSTDGNAHSLDLLYDDYIGLKSSSAQRGYEFPGQSTFSAYTAGATVPGPGSAPASVLVRSNLAAADGSTSEAVGAITFSTPPNGFVFASNSEFEEHQVLQVPAGGSASLSYIYSTSYTVAQTQQLALAAQDRFEPPTLTITSPPGGTTVSSPSVTVTGTAAAGSGISSVVVSGMSVPVAPGGTWSAQAPLSQGSNTITALATDAAGATVQGQVAVVFAQAPPPPASPPPTSPMCRVPRLRGMKLAAAEHALRRAHCGVGRIRHEHTKKEHRGRIVGTNPDAGHRMPAGRKVELFVSIGP